MIGCFVEGQRRSVFLAEQLLVVELKYNLVTIWYADIVACEI